MVPVHHAKALTKRTGMYAGAGVLLWAALTGYLAWPALPADGPWLRALALALASGAVATGLALAACAALLSAMPLGMPARGWPRLLPAFLALPHMAFALGVLLLLSPSGMLVRFLFALLAPLQALLPWPLDTPPDWQSTQDPWGLGLVLVLVCKETPFLLWCALAQWQRPDLAQRWRREMALARTWGYSERRAWWRVVWPQLVPRLGGPLLAVAMYSVSVIDVAWIIGPGAPPTLAVLAWQWLQDANPAQRAQGLAAMAVLAACTAVLAVLACAAYQSWLRMGGRRRWSGGPAAMPPLASQGLYVPHSPYSPALPWRPRLAYRTLAAVYLAVAAALAFSSVAGAWPFPAVWPQQWTLQAWQLVAGSSAALGTTLWLAFASALSALALAVALLEALPRRFHTALMGLALCALLVPALVWAWLLQTGALALGLEGSVTGLWLAHTLTVWPYLVLSLQAPYAGVDGRLAAVAASLGRSRWTFLWQVQLPLLRGALAGAGAIGFAVSVAQFLPTLFVGGGRFSTVSTEALALSSGGQRSLVAAYALLQWVLPACAFALAWWLGRARRFALPALH
jgi:putative thiamine transport system permease protein